MVVVNCDLFDAYIERCGVKHLKLWNKYSAISLRMGKLFRKLKIYILGNINPLLSSITDDTIVVFDNGISENSILKWIARRHRDKRLIFYYWNPVFKSILPSKIPDSFECWSYSPEDCEKYNMKYNSTFYFEFLYKSHSRIKRDVFFIGKNKGRLNNLMKIKNKLTHLGFSSLFYITANHPRLNQKSFMKNIPYRETLDYVNESKAILDYYVDPQAGLSLRAMESLFFEKKVITNNTTYFNYDFYKKNNIFVIGYDSENDLEHFFTTPYIPVEKEIKEKYLFSYWMNRFLMGS